MDELNNIYSQIEAQADRILLTSRRLKEIESVQEAQALAHVITIDSILLIDYLSDAKAEGGRA